MLRNAAQNIDQGNRGAISGYATEFAGEIDRFADRLRVSSWRVLAADIEDFGRRWPALFMASSAIAGFVVGRVLTSPPRHLLPGGTPTGEGPSAGPLGTQQSTATGGTLSQGGAATGFGLPSGEETP
jgi:hypothetical protein